MDIKELAAIDKARLAATGPRKVSDEVLALEARVRARRQAVRDAKLAATQAASRAQAGQPLASASAAPAVPMVKDNGWRAALSAVLSRRGMRLEDEGAGDQAQGEADAPEPAPAADDAAETTDSVDDSADPPADDESGSDTDTETDKTESDGDNASDDASQAASAHGWDTALARVLERR